MKILLAVDGSLFTKRMLDIALAPGQWPGADNDFVVLHCVAPWPHRAAAFVDEETVRRYYDEDAESVLGPVRSALAEHGIDAQYRHALGGAHEIARQAEQGDFDLVVMGSHGRAAWSHVVLGSVTTTVLALCKTPVLVIR